MQFYTSVHKWGKKILYRGWNNGKRVQGKYDYQPTLFLTPNKDKTPTHYGIHGEPLVAKKFADMKRARNFIKEYSDVSGIDVHGFERFEYAYINEKFPDRIEFDMDTIRVANIDIEVDSSDGFPDPKNAEKEIVSIALKFRNDYYVFGLVDYEEEADNIHYQKFDTESELIIAFLKFWQHIDVDVVTGWYITFFDIPYMVNRIMKIFNEDMAKNLSPWRHFSERVTTIKGRTQQMFDLMGIAILDYQELFLKYEKEYSSYKLDFIATEVLGEGKLDFSEYANLNQLYKNDPQKFIRYNIRDVERVDALDKKKKLIEQVFVIAYDSKVNPTDAFTQVKMWDVIIHNHLAKKGIAVPLKRDTDKENFKGGFVKEPQIGRFGWLASFDLTSLYPHLIMMYNIGPETLIEGVYFDFSIDDVIHNTEKFQKAHNWAVKNNASLAGNGHVYRNDRKSFFNELMELFYVSRKEYKDKKLECEREFERTGIEKFKTEAKVYDNMQLAKKVGLNSIFGATGNQYFRYFDVRNAEAITKSGQLAIIWIAHFINNFMKEKTGVERDYILAMDTDSCYIDLEDVVHESFKDKPEATTSDIVDFVDGYCDREIQPVIDEAYRELARRMNAYAHKMFMKREVIADTGIWTGKKHYILNVWDDEGVRYDTPKIKITGIEAVKSNTPAICRNALKEAFRIIMQSDEKGIQDYVKKFKQEFLKAPFEDIGKPTSVNGLGVYYDSANLFKKGSPHHVKAALYYNYLLSEKGLDKSFEMIREGEKIKTIYLKKDVPTLTDAIGFINFLPKEFNMNDMVDRDLQFQKTFIDPLNSILKVIGWTSKKKGKLPFGQKTS